MDEAPTTAEILSAVDAIQTEAISFLKSIVSIDSTLEKGEGLIQSEIHRHLLEVFDAADTSVAKTPGDGNGENNETSSSSKRKRLNQFEVERIPVKLDDIRSQRGFSPVDWNYSDDQKFNVVVRYSHDSSGNGGSESAEKPQVKGGRNLLLQGHIDVVPASESDGWTNPPFSPIIRNSKNEVIDVNECKDHPDARMYGRGSGDMKAGVVAMIYALLALRRLGYVPKGNVSICTVIEEECTGNGALAAPLEILLPSLSTDLNENIKTAVIIPEPFPFLVTAQLGVLWFRASVTGKPCHVLQTSAGSNAIEGAYVLYNSLKALEEKYNEPKGNAHPAYRGIDHPVNFNLGKIEGGNWASSVPSSCWFEARVGFFPGKSVESVKQDIEVALKAKANELGLGLEISYRGFHAEGAVLLSEYVGVDEESYEMEELECEKKSLQKEFVELLQCCHEVSIVPSPADGGSNEDSCDKSDNIPNLAMKPITCTCDCRFYSSLYHDPNNVVVTCFGPEATNIHGVDESVSLKSVRDVTCTIALFVKDWCGLIKEDR
mmetsp:Transcript_2293/g.4961  ORF Transcript_2293/g.4961 Transcript_2293/m.4961 type:complete len:546 (+) Transcript_2293:138-1775(+)